ncbi:MAG: lysozyme inhibitor LprI family protein [Flavobacteriaceae bacterium]
MKTITTFLLFLVCGISFSQSQEEMNQEAYSNYQRADTELNQVYQQILKEYQHDTLFIEKLKEVQRLWVGYRDAQVLMKYPYENKGSEYGDVFPMCVSYYLQELTQYRTEDLRLWLQGVEEGDVCSGSVKIN